MPDEPVHARLRQPRPVLLRLVRGGPAAGVGDRVDEKLEAEGDRARLRHDRREVRPGRVPADREPLGVAAERLGVRARPRGRREGVLEAGRERMLGRQPVVDREYGVATLVGERPREVVVRLEVAEHPAAAVQEDEQPEARLGARPVEARGDASGVDVANLRERDGGRPQARGAQGANGLGRALLDRRVAEGLDRSSSAWACGWSGTLASVALAVTAREADPRLVLFQAQVEARRCMDVEEPRDRVRAVREVVPEAWGHEHERPGAGDDLLVLDGEDQLALQHVEGVVLIGVRVRPGALAARLDRDDGEVEPRRVRAASEELDVPDAMSLARPDDDRAVSAHAPIPPRRR